MLAAAAPPAAPELAPALVVVPVDVAEGVLYADVTGVLPTTAEMSSRKVENCEAAAAVDLFAGRVWASSQQSASRQEYSQNRATGAKMRFGQAGSERSNGHSQTCVPVATGMDDAVASTAAAEPVIPAEAAIRADTVVSLSDCTPPRRCRGAYGS